MDASTFSSLAQSLESSRSLLITAYETVRGTIASELLAELSKEFSGWSISPCLRFTKPASSELSKGMSGSSIPQILRTQKLDSESDDGAFPTLPSDALDCSLSIAAIDCSLPLRPPVSIVVIESTTDAVSDEDDSEVEADE